MTLIPLWNGQLRLPALASRKKKIGNNNISRFVVPESICDGTIFYSEYEQYYKIETKFKDDLFSTIYLKRHGFKFYPKIQMPVLSTSIKDPIYKLSLDTPFRWEHLPDLLIKEISPNEVLKSWQGHFRFISEKDYGEGLRPPQLGAIHAISSYFSVGDHHEPATIVLPTGTGKTETMLSVLAYLRLPKLLVLVPTNILRKQLSEKFLTLGILPLTGVVPFQIQRPWVATITTGIGSKQEAIDLIINSNVIIATPQIINSSSKEAKKVLFDNCTDLFIDEAHHSPANTWDKIRNEFAEKRVCQFTATPFRNDEKEIGGKIIFNYRLGDAQKDGYYKSIRYYPIEEYGEEEECDLQIASKAVYILREDLNNSRIILDHILMVRTNKNEKADKLSAIYSKIAPEFNPVVIHSEKSKKDNLLSLQQVIERKSRIIICVDMLGEGFDLPQLKIAAIHEYHKSLAITLQFIGRLTRQSKNVGNAAIILNIADPEVDKGLAKLYSANADWDRIIMRLSEATINREIKIQEIIEKLKHNGTLANQVSLRSLRPTFTSQIYKVLTNEWNPLSYKEVLSSNSTCYHSLSNSPNILILLSISEEDVKWGKLQGLSDILHNLFIAYWNEHDSSLFVYCSDYNGFKVESIVKRLFNNNIELVAGSQIFNILNNVQLPLVKNLGSSKAGVISFTQYFGPNVTDGLSEIEKYESNLSNIACLGYEDGEKVLWGAAQKKGKIWSMSTGSISDWMDWCDKIWIKVNSPTSHDNITQNFLRPIPLNTYHTEPAISIDWGEKLQLKSFDQVNILFEGRQFPLYFVDICIHNIGMSGPIEIEFSAEDLSSIYTLEIDNKIPGGYKYTLKEGGKVMFIIGKKEPKSLEEYLLTDPLIINYSDGSQSYNKYLIQPNLEPGRFDLTNIEVWDWNGVHLNEESMGKEMSSTSIQYKAFETFRTDYDIIINDDDKGEAGDLVCLKQIDERLINLTLIHCKNAINNKPGSDIRDMYTVCGQAQKSIKIKHKGLKELFQNIKLRETKWKSTGHSRFLKGDLKAFEYLKNKSRTSRIDFNVIIVQPGISKQKISDDILRLLGTTELYIKKTCEGTFRVVVNK